MAGWFFACCALLMLMLVCRDAGSAEASAVTGQWHVVLVAGDDAEPVFDNATRAMTRRLAASGVPIENVHRFSASSTELGGKVELAYAEPILRRIAQLPAKPGDRCLIFFTSHGERGAGVWLARSNRALTPDELAGALSRGCGAVPTIVIVSACYSGSFATGKMAKPNRIILTAARGDRPSFGCQAHRTYNFFDECVLGVFPQSTTWRGVFDNANHCVRRMEQTLGMRASEPQAYFGGAVGALKLGL